MLSEKRATAVSDYLDNKNINTSLVTIKGFGETAAKYENTTAEGRA